ncbi:hypothetical protein CC79DRAFT_1321537 [Sarocladium strictum]
MFNNIGESSVRTRPRGCKPFGGLRANPEPAIGRTRWQLKLDWDIVYSLTAMANRFVSGGVIDSSGEVAEKGQGTGESAKETSKNSEWEAVQKELEAERKRRDEQRIKAASGEEKSLFEILQANKEAKQAAFEEQNKIRNQFLSLNEDDIDFLDEVRERQRKEDEEKKRELENGLKAFREARKAEGLTTSSAEGEDQVAGEGAGESWEVGGRKRKRVKGREREVKGVRRKVDEGEKKDETTDKDSTKVESSKGEAREAAITSTTQPAKTAVPSSTGGSKSLGLVAYGSDDSDDE